MDGFGRTVIVAISVFATSVSVCAAQSRPAVGDPFQSFELPDEWEATFWDTPGVKAFFELDSKALAARVPEQAGLRHCRCPQCDAPYFALRKFTRFTRRTATSPARPSRFSRRIWALPTVTTFRPPNGIGRAASMFR
jgi:hypothetical protein